MDSTWRFRDAPGGCEVHFEVDFRISRNRLLQGAAGMFFNEAMQRIVRAFERRAAELQRAGRHAASLEITLGQVCPCV